MLGAKLFGGLHSALNLSIWLLVPFLSSDCISRERRENTLGLLFLTPLSPFDIVLAKSLVHGWRALMLWLAVLPVLAVPMLIGGVTGQAVMTSALSNFSALCWAMSAGLLASAFSRSRSQALWMAGLFTLCGFILQGFVTGLILYANLAQDYGWSWFEITFRGIVLNFLSISGWSYLQAIPPGSAGGSQGIGALQAFGKITGWSLLALPVSMLIAARTIRLNWQEKPPGKSYIWFLRVFCEPFIWRAFFKLWIRRKLEKNPLGWLEQRNWTGRTAIAVWLAIVMSFYIAMLNDTTYYRRFNTEVQFALGLVLALAMTTVAAGSFRRERDLGVMELLLVTPMTEAEMALGRLKGIWAQFVPALVLLLVLWLTISLTFGTKEDFVLIVFWAVTFACLPVTGLCQSLKRRGTVGAVMWTVWMALLVPLGVAVLMDLRLQILLPAAGRTEYRWQAWILPVVWQVGCAVRSWIRLKGSLIRRDFPFEVN
jgi:ABC-type transport system involved in multi-copper enzyme maturation permease subunit